MKKVLIISFIIFCLFIAGLTGFLFVQRQPVPKPTHPPVVEQISWKGVTPGKTTLDELVATLGQPVSLAQEGNITRLSYQSTSKFWTNDVEIQNNTVVYIKERRFFTDETSFKLILSHLKETPIKLFGPESNSGMFLFVFPERGVAYLANEQSDIVFQVWYFPGTTLTSFLLLPQAKGYSTSEEVPPEQF